MSQCVLFAGRQPAQCKCKWCGRWGRAIECKVDSDMRAEIAQYATDNGPRWRAKLAKEWEQGADTLRNVRNVLGPSGVMKIQTKAIEHYNRVKKFHSELKEI